jgi:hypothetical protein
MEINREVLRHGAVVARYGSVALAGIAIGFGVSHYRLKKEMAESQTRQTRLQIQIKGMQTQVKELGDILKKRTEALNTLSEAIDAASADKMPLDEPEKPELLELLDSYRIPEIPARVVSIFPEEKPKPWDQEKENADRERYQGRPYVISVEEFQANELDLPQQTVTFYEGDRVLVDYEDVPIYNYPNVVGELLFGHGSGDPNIVYVRNPRGKVEYEVLRDHGHYASEVLGHEIEHEHEESDLKHGDIRRFRRDD